MIKTNFSQGISVSVLKPGTTLEIETKRSIYKAEIVEGKEVLLQGGMLKNGRIRYEGPTLATVRGSINPEGFLEVDRIEPFSPLEIRVGNNLLKTGSVQNVKITAPDNSWTYSMDWNK